MGGGSKSANITLEPHTRNSDPLVSFRLTRKCLAQEHDAFLILNADERVRSGLLATLSFPSCITH
jgi:hypothetical protein